MAYFDLDTNETGEGAGLVAAHRKHGDPAYSKVTAKALDEPRQVIAARHMGINVLAISCVTNMAAGILDKPLSSVEVFETTERVRGDFVALLRAVIPEIAGELKD